MTKLDVPNPWGGRCWYVEETGSTMDEALGLQAGGQPSGSLVQAGFQSRGVGRHAGRAWTSRAEQSLLFTVFWNWNEFAVPTFAPSLTVGLGVCLWLESLPLAAGTSVRLKWPNDVYLDHRKVCGILVRARVAGDAPPVVHAGLGINLLQDEFPEDFRSSPVSLLQKGICKPPREALTELLPFLHSAMRLEDPRGECEQRLWRRGEYHEVTVPGGEHALKGLVRGLDDAGRLKLETPAGLSVVSSGE